MAQAEGPTDFDIIDIDFTRASRYYAATAFGRPKDEVFAALKAKYKDDGIVDPLVFLFGQARVVDSTPLPHEMVVVPRIPTDKMWEGLPRAIMSWLDFGDKRTVASLFNHLRDCELIIPQWLRDDLKPYGMDKVPSKGARAVIVYKAFLEEHRKEAAPLSRPMTKDEIFNLYKGAFRGYGIPDSVIEHLVYDVSTDVPAEDHVGIAETIVALTQIPSAEERCTCLSDLGHDAYGPGGPSSGHPLPVCKVHNRTFKE